IIDNVILMIANCGVALVIQVPVAAASDSSSDLMVLAELLTGVLQFAVGIAYTIYFLAQHGATPGKMLLKLRVVSVDGSSLSWGTATGRAFAEILSGLTCAIGYIIAAFDEEKRALHDHLCNTRV